MSSHLQAHEAAKLLGGDVSGDGVLCPGPRHSSRDRSLSVKFDPEARGGILVNSFAGDDPIACKDHVRQLLGLEPFKSANERSNGHGNGNGHIQKTPELRPIRARMEPAPRSEKCIPVLSTELRRHVYRTADGVEVKMKIKKAGGDYTQWFNVNGGWQSSKPKGTVFPTIPYVTWELNPLDPELAGDEIYWPEGEKDVDTLGKLNLPAFTYGGVSDPLPADLSIFAGKRIVVLADNDDVGLRHAQKKVERAIDVAAAVKIVSFEQKDVSDYIAAGHIVEDLRQRVDTVPWNAAKKDAEQPKADNRLFSAEALNAMVFEPINYFVEGLIAEGLTLFAGQPKIGKSWMLLHMAHEVADGGYTLGGIPCAGGDVLYAALEDNKRRLQRRMTKLFGLEHWPANLKFTCEMPKLADGGIQYIKDWIENAKCPRLVIIDTLAMVRSPSRKDQNSYEADYAAVKELRDLAAANSIAIIIVHHLRKADADDPFDTVSGTLGLTGAPDTIMIIWREGNGVLLAAKGRDIEEVKKAIQFDAKTCLWTIIGDAEVVQRSAARSTVIKALEEANGEPLGAQQIAAATGMKPANVRQLLATMKREGLITATSTYGKYLIAGVRTERLEV